MLYSEIVFLLSVDNKLKGNCKIKSENEKQKNKRSQNASSCKKALALHNNICNFRYVELFNIRSSKNVDILFVAHDAFLV
jgi:hypothetical protein